MIDDYGIPVKEAQEDVDEFGIPIKRKSIARGEVGAGIFGQRQQPLQRPEQPQKPPTIREALQDYAQKHQYAKNAILGYDVAGVPKGQVGAQIITQKEQAEENKLNTAAENTFKKTMGKGAYSKADSATYVNHLKEGVRNGDLGITPDAQGNDVIKNKGGFFESIKAGADLVYAQGIEDKYLKSISKNEAISYMNMVRQHPELGIVKEMPFAPQEVGAFIGEQLNFLGKATIGGLAGAQTGLTGGASAGSFLTIVEDLANSGYSQALKKNYYILKDEGLSDSEAFDKATHAALLGEAVSLGTGILLSGEINMLPKRTLSGEGRLITPKPTTAATNGFMESVGHTLKTAPKVVGSAMLGSVINDIETNAIANGTPIDRKQMIKNAQEHGLPMLIIHSSLGALAAIANGRRTVVPSYVRPQMENVAASANRDEVSSFFQVGENGGIFPKGTTQKILDKLNKFDIQKKAVDKLPISEEKKAAITGKLLQRKSLVAETENLEKFGVAFKDRILENNKRISEIDDEIKAMYASDNFLKHEKDEVTGESATHQEDIDTKVAAAQKRLGLPTSPEPVLSDAAQKVVDKINNGENVLNSDLDLLSNELYTWHKTFSETKEEYSRKFTRQQYDDKLADLENQITVLENHKNRQAEADEFIKINPDEFNRRPEEVSTETIPKEEVKKEAEVPIEKTDVGTSEVTEGENYNGTLRKDGNDTFFKVESEHGRSSGVVGDYVIDPKTGEKHNLKTFTLGRIDAKEKGKGQGYEVLKQTIDFAKKQNIQVLESPSLNEFSRKTVEKAVEEGLLSPFIEGVNGKDIAWKIEKTDVGTKAVAEGEKKAEPKAVYSAVFVNPDELVSKYGQRHPNLYSHHSTIEFKPSDISELPIGQQKDIKVIGRLTTDKVDVLLVDNPLSKNEHPHITLSTAEGIKPAESNQEIKDNLDKIQPLKETIKGTVGYYDGKNDIVEAKTLQEAPKAKEEIKPPTEIEKLKEQRDKEIEEATKPDVKLKLIQGKELANAKDPFEAKRLHDIIKDRYKKLLKAADCIG